MAVERIDFKRLEDNMALISLMTDFGYRDNFVGVMKGVISGINPEARIIDLTHGLPVHDVGAAAFSLYGAYKYFPDRTIHVAVVDPGVGGQRDILAVRGDRWTFLAPDNGLLTYVLAEIAVFEARRVENRDLMLPSISRTFHGRDIFAPLAAHLSLGAPFESLGPVTETFTRLPALEPEFVSGGLIGRVVYVDRFGNLMTNIPNEALAAFRNSSPTIRVGAWTINGLARSYGDHPSGELLAIAGSTGYLEIARNLGRAESPPELQVGAQVFVAAGEVN